MKCIRTEDAVGQILCHDMTQIIKDVKKDAVFRKGHIITEEDIPVLLSIGKEHIYVWDNPEGMVHENDGAEILRQLSQGANLEAGDPKEGKIALKATCDGVLKLKTDKLLAINSIGEMMIATKRRNVLVKKGHAAAAMRIIPLMIHEDKMKLAREVAGDEPIGSIMPLLPKKAAILATGSEIYKGRIEDTFTPVVEGKLTALGAEVIDKRILDDNADMTTANILEVIEKGAELVCVTGGMSVDPDDRTPLAIKQTGAEIISYGAPVLPGAMFMVSYFHKKTEDGEKLIPIVGLPGCVMYAGNTIFDMVLPRLLADDKVKLEEIQAMGEGGLL
ncbi:MAG: molybdopterin-binding protein [Lachnospiraceae bacterium]|nr:molybdopterin-binding protein [Candidatus Equihabitans merdae]